jgi:hypothetical protein
MAIAYSTEDAARAEPYGLLAEFDGPETLVDATRRAYEAGYRRLDAYSPFPIDELTEVLEIRPTILPILVAVAGVIGAITGYGLQYFTLVINYPYNVGGRPLNSWPAFIPITFETTILFAGITAFLAIIMMNGLPEPYHPVFNVPGFEHASQDRFYLAIETRDPKFDRTETRQFLESLHPLVILDVDG